MRDADAILWITVLLAVTVAATLVVPGVPPAGAEEPSLDTGTIYYARDGVMYRMNPDGTSKTSLSTKLAWHAEPSIRLHNGRWFLQVDEVQGQTYPGDSRYTGEPRSRLELFAVHESGSPTVQLTDGKIDDNTFIEPNSRENPSEGGQWAAVRWTKGDTRVSYLALKTSYASGQRTVSDGGIYTVAVDPGDLASHTKVSMSGAPLLGLPRGQDILGVYFMSASYDWKPDMSELVYYAAFLSSPSLWLAKASDGFSTSTKLADRGWDPRWSPAGNKILFNGGLTMGIKSIGADGTSETLLIADPPDGRNDQTYLRDLDWSPNGTHFIYGYYYYNHKKNTGICDVHRATASGDSRTDLTSDTEGWCSYPKWRGTGNPPTVTITQPTDGSDVWGTTTIKATATDDGTVDQVEFFVDGTSIGTDSASPFEINWSSTSVLDGEHTILAVATDSSDETGSDTVAVTVDNVDDPPEVTITDPDHGDTVSGTSVTIAATASDDGSVAKVEFFAGTTLIGTDTTNPYSITWDSTSVSDGSHSLSATATDDAGKTDTDVITVTVNNAPPTLSVTSISPNNVRAGKSVNVRVSGTGFTAGAGLTLANGSGPAVTLSNVSVVNSTTITAKIAAARSSSKGTWKWDVVVTNPGGASATVADGFTVKK